MEQRRLVLLFVDVRRRGRERGLSRRQKGIGGIRGITSRGGVAVVLAAGLVFTAWAPANALSIPLLRHEDKQHKEIESLEAEWRGALVRNDEATLGRLLADDYLGVNPDGTLETKADALALRRSGLYKITRIDPDRIKVHVYGDTAVVSSLVDIAGQEGDRDISGRYHYTRVYRKRGGLWKVVSFEASRLANR